MGYEKTKRPTMEPAERIFGVASASSAGATLPPRGIGLLYSTSTVAATPTVMYIPPPQNRGDILDVFCMLASSSAGAVLRTSTSGAFIGSSSMGYDNLLFSYTGGGAELIALTSTLWGCNAATTTAAGSSPVLGVSTS